MNSSKPPPPLPPTSLPPHPQTKNSSAQLICDHLPHYTQTHPLITNLHSKSQLSPSRGICTHRVEAVRPASVRRCAQLRAFKEVVDVLPHQCVCVEEHASVGSCMPYRA